MDDATTDIKLDNPNADTTRTVDPIFHELRGIKEEKISTRYFVCNYCKNWSLVKEEDLIDPSKPRKEIEKMSIHMELDRDVGVIWKKFKANFGTYEAALLFLLNDFNKKQQS